MYSPSVLIVEDEAELRQLIAKSLADAGYRVCTAGNGEEALIVLREDPSIEVLLSDIRMPSMDGYTLAEAGLGLRPELKVLLMTGFEERAPSHLLVAREIRTLHKPIRMSRLQELVSGMIQPP